ncbi:MAG: anti-sigma F factor [Anaerovorax sp.]
MANLMKLELLNRSENERVARICVSAFVATLDPTMEELTEIKTAVSEAVSNSIIHGYDQGQEGKIFIECSVDQRNYVTIVVSDEGVGIEDVAQAREPLFTSKPTEERSGMGFTVMESFMDRLAVESDPGKGTKVTMVKILDKPYEL